MSRRKQKATANDGDGTGTEREQGDGQSFRIRLQDGIHFAACDYFVCAEISAFSDNF